MNPFTLENKTILVTGASSGIGAQTAISISELGAKVILTARNKERLEDTLKKLKGTEHSLICADLTDAEDLNQLIKELPSLDGIVHSSGIEKPFPIKFIQKKQIDDVRKINYDAPLVLTAQLLKAKKINKNASIVFISSIAAHFSYKGGAIYSGSKAAINSLSKTLALEYAPQKIRSNVITAAMIETPLLEKVEKNITKEALDSHRATYPLGFGEPLDVANATSFLLSNASKWMTGTEIVLDGGLTAGLFSM